ncbi:MAG: DUF1737 domain-containing protein [Alphaproteobacteria bacterium]
MRVHVDGNADLDGYVLHGDPASTYDPERGRVIVAQAVILRDV